MAKIDVSTIEGYADMTPEQKVAALEGMDLPDPDLSGYVAKKTFDKTASELADLKKKQREMLSEDERKRAESAEEVETLRNQVAELTKRETTAQYAANLIGQGYSPELAADTAAAMVDGDMTKVFANSQKFLEDYAKQVKADQIKGTPRPPAGSPSGAEYQKMIDDALAEDNQAKAAYYIRIREQSK